MSNSLYQSEQTQIIRIKQTLKIKAQIQSKNNNLSLSNSQNLPQKSMNRQKKLRLIISSMKQKELVRFFQLFLQSSRCQFHKNIKQISYSCFESTCQIENYVVNGYGKTQSESLVSGINNLIDCLVEDETYCELMKEAIKRSNMSSYHFLNSMGGGNGSVSKKLLSTQKAVKTLASETPLSVDKKVLTMSANMSSKQSSSKSKSIKQEIFEYFNLQNLKVKNPSGQQQQFSTISPMAASTNKMKASDEFMINHQEKQKRSITYNNNNFNQRVQQQKSSVGQSFDGNNNVGKSDELGELEAVYRKIRQIKEQISAKEKQNLKLKQEILYKRTKQHNVLIEGNCDKQQPINSQYFTRQSLQPKPNPKPSQPTGTQSTKKLSYLQMSLNDKLLTKSNQLQSALMDNFNKQNTKNIIRKDLIPNKSQQQNHQQQQVNKQYRLISNKYSLQKSKQQFVECEFVNVQLKSSVTANNNNIPMTQSIKTNNNQQLQRRCLVDISNLNLNNNLGMANNDKMQNLKNNIALNMSGSHTPGGAKPELYHFHTIKENSFQTLKQNTFQTAKLPTQQPRHPLLYQKLTQQSSSVESNKKLRSFSVQNHLPDKITSLKSNNTSIMNNNNTINSSLLNCSNNNMNSSFDNAGVGQAQHKKIKIPKLNLEILPNYHGRSNKSLNQSLMDNYSKNKAPININQ